MINKIDLLSVRKKYEDYIYQWNKSFSKSSLWWYIPSSSRERLGSLVQDKFVRYVLNEPYSSDSLRINNWKNWITVKFPFFKSILSLLRDSFLILKLLLSKRNINLKENIDITFIHPIHDLPSRKINDKNWNHYFGELPDYYSSRGKKVEMIGPVDSNILFKQEMFSSENYVITNVIFFLRFRDLLKIYFSIISFFLFQKNFPKPNDQLEKKLHQLINEEIKTKLYNLFWGSVYKFAFAQYLKTRKPSLVFHTYENNWWERAVDIACEENRNIVKKKIGFLHCSILDAHMKYSLLNDEWSLKPSPDEILVTGKQAKKILLRRGNYEEKIIRVGYDLRGPNLYNIKQRKNRPVNINKILVLLEGLNTMPKFLKLVLETVGNLDYELSVRCHPVFPITQPEFKEVREHSLFSKLTVSKNSSLDEDLDKADLVIYKGSTAALYAGYMGIPMLKFKDEWWASDDPLVECKFFKKEFSNSIELLEAVKYFSGMEDTLYEKEKKNIQDYIFEYMTPYKDFELNKLAEELIQ